MPSLSLVITGPLAGVWIYYLYASNLAEFSFEGFLSAPVWQTLVLFYVPVLLTGGCFTILYELKQRRESRILSRLPEAFKSASDANARGLTIKESFEIVASNSAGSLAKQLTLAVNSTTWTGDLNSALIDFANSLQVPRLSRTIKLITKANEVSGDIQSVLTVAARDVENMANLDRERKANAFTYMAIILVSFLVSMGVIVALDAEFLSRLASNEAFSGGGGNGLGGFGGGGEIPIREFRMAFLHAVMALGGSSGLVAGSMADNDILAGFKYALVMMGLALLVFGIF
jgi:flagellar protein FlaJ